MSLRSDVADITHTLRGKPRQPFWLCTGGVIPPLLPFVCDRAGLLDPQDLAVDVDDDLESHHAKVCPHILWQTYLQKLVELLVYVFQLLLDGSLGEHILLPQHFGGLLGKEVFTAFHHLRQLVEHLPVHLGPVDRAPGSAPGVLTLEEADGMIAVDPVLMKGLMPGTGSFHTKPYNLYVTANRVVHFLLYKAYASYPIPKVRRSRLRAVVDDFYEHMLKPKHPTELIDGFGSALAGKHMQVWLRDPAEQAFIERMNWDGAIEPDITGDYLYVVNDIVSVVSYLENRAYDAIAAHDKLQHNVHDSPEDFDERYPDEFTGRDSLVASILATAATEVATPVYPPGPHCNELGLTDLGAYTIRQMAAEHGMVALEGLARCSAQRALLPGCRVAMQSCLEHLDEAHAGGAG